MVEKCSPAPGMWFRRRPWGGGRFFEGVGWCFGIRMVVMRGGEGYRRGCDTNGPPRRRRRVTEAVKAVGLPPAGGGKVVAVVGRWLGVEIFLNFFKVFLLILFNY